MKNTGNKKRTTSGITSKPIKTYEDIVEFESKLETSNLTPEQLEQYFSNITEEPEIIFDSEEEHQRYIENEFDTRYVDQYFTKDGKKLIYKDNPKLQEMIKSGEAISGYDYDYQEVVGQTKDGQNLEHEIPFEPMIFHSKGKTSQGVRYLKVSVTTSFGEIDDAFHNLHMKIRSSKINNGSKK